MHLKREPDQGPGTRPTLKNRLSHESSRVLPLARRSVSASDPEADIRKVGFGERESRFRQLLLNDLFMETPLVEIGRATQAENA